MTGDDILKSIIEKDKETLDLLEKLKNVLKDEKTHEIKELILNNDYDHAKKIITKLDEFNDFQFTSNLSELISFVEHAFTLSGEGELPQSRPSTEKVNFSALKNIGKQGLCRLEDLDGTVSVSDIRLLESQKLVITKNVEYGDLSYQTLELSSKGKTSYEEHFGIKPDSNSFYKKLLNRYNNKEISFFLYDIENALEKKGYQIESFYLSDHYIEITKERSHYYLILDFGLFSENDYEKLLDELHQKYNIGFISPTEFSLKSARLHAYNWFSKKTTKPTFLNFYFLTLDDIKSEDEFFQVVNF